MEPKVYHGKNIDEAIKLACQDLNVAREKLHVEVIDLGKRGFLGIGRKPATVKVTFLKDVIADLEISENENNDANLTSTSSGAKVPVSKEATKVNALSPKDQAAALKIQKMLEELFRQSKIVAQVSYQVKDDQIIFTIDSAEYKGLIIGKKGKTINSLQAIAQNVFSHQSENRYYIILDIDNYRELRSRQIQDWLNQAVTVVRNNGRSYRFSPMIAVERKTMINQISQFKDIAFRIRGRYPRKYIEIYQKLA